MGLLPVLRADTGTMSLIEPALWHQAGWAGVAFGYRASTPPLVAMVFQHLAPAEQIFHGLHDRVGSVDREEGIRVAFVEAGDALSSCAVHVCANPSIEAHGVSVCRLHWMGPGAPQLARFRAEFERQGRYLLVPGVVTSLGDLTLLDHLAIEKTQIAFRRAADVRADDIDGPVLGLDVNEHAALCVH